MAAIIQSIVFPPEAVILNFAICAFYALFRPQKLQKGREQRTCCVIPKLWRDVPRRNERISQKFRRIFALDVCTRLSPYGLSPCATATRKSDG
jgi:hypothetical protein